MPDDAKSIIAEKRTALQRLAEQASSPRGRKFLLIGLGAGLALVTLRFVIDRATYVTTADARVATEIIAVSSDISGRITSVQVREGDTVAKDAVLYTIDDREAALVLKQYQAEADRLHAEMTREEMRAGLATSKAGSQVDARRAGTQSAVASVAVAESNLETARREHDRTEDLFDRKFISQSQFDLAKNALATAEQALQRAQADRASAAAEQRTASISGQEVRLIDHDLAILKARLVQAEARVEAQKVIVEHHTIRSPISGVVDELFYDEGEHSLRSFRMAMVHDPKSVWVSANIKETEIRFIQPGASVAITADSDPSHKMRGKVRRVNDLTLAEAAMMPNPNASGVFTKITQRIKVRIDLEPADVQLRSGTMVSAKIRKEKPGRAVEAAAP